MAKNASSFVYSVINGCALRIIDSFTLEINNPFREKRKEGVLPLLEKVLILFLE